MADSKAGNEYYSSSLALALLLFLGTAMVPVTLFAQSNPSGTAGNGSYLLANIVPEELDGKLSLLIETKSPANQEVYVSIRTRHRDSNRNTSKQSQEGRLLIREGLDRSSPVLQINLVAESGTVLGYLSMVGADSIWAYDTLVYNYGNRAVERVADGGVLEEENSQETSWESIGMVIDDTRSRLGSDFYQAFYKYWEEPREHNGYQIRISDLPARGRSFRLLIHLDDRQVVNTFLPQKYDDIEDLAKRAVRVMHYQVNNAQQLQNALDAELTTSTDTY